MKNCKREDLLEKKKEREREDLWIKKCRHCSMIVKRLLLNYYNRYLNKRSRGEKMIFGKYSDQMQFNLKNL